MNDLNTILIISILILLYIKYNSKIKRFLSFDNFTVGEGIKSAGYAASFYMDHYKFMVIKDNQEPMVLFDAVNTFHTGDILYVQCNMAGNDCPMFLDPYGTNYLQDTGRCRKIEQKDSELTWIPVANIISVMEVDAFAVIVLDAAVNITGRKLGVKASPKSAHLWETTIYPDANKTPVTEIMSVSRWVVPREPF